MKTTIRFYKSTAWLLTLTMLITFIPSFTLSVNAEDTVGGADINSTYTIAFDASGGDGTMDDVKVNSGVYILHVCEFTMTNKLFKAWNIKDAEYAPGDEITVTDDIIISAIWCDDPNNYEVHSHVICSASACKGHPQVPTPDNPDPSDFFHDSDKLYTALLTTDDVGLASNSYYLHHDLVVENTLIITDEVNLCLNGYTISLAEGKTCPVFMIAQGENSYRYAEPLRLQRRR